MCERALLILLLDVSVCVCVLGGGSDFGDGGGLAGKQ